MYWLLHSLFFEMTAGPKLMAFVLQSPAYVVFVLAGLIKKETAEESLYGPVSPGPSPLYGLDSQLRRSETRRDLCPLMVLMALLKSSCGPKGPLILKGLCGPD